MDTAQLFFRGRNVKNDEALLDKVQSYLAALLHNGQIVGAGAQTHVPFLRQGLAASGAAAPKLRLPVPALSPALERRV